MDALLKSLHDVALTLMPTLGAICLVLVIMILYRVHKVVKDLPKTISGVDSILESTKKSVDSLEEPLNAFRNVATTVDKVNSSAVGIANKAVQFGLKNTDLVAGFFSRGDAAKSAVAKEDNSNLNANNSNSSASDSNVNASVPNVKKEEDFGTYE